MVRIIEDKARDIFQTMSTFKGQDFKVEQTFTISVFNVLWRIVGGKRYEVVIQKYNIFYPMYHY